MYQKESSVKKGYVSREFVVINEEIIEDQLHMFIDIDELEEAVYKTIEAGTEVIVFARVKNAFGHFEDAYVAFIPSENEAHLIHTNLIKFEDDVPII